MRAPVMILPGLGSSGPDHWQSHWERRDPGCARVQQKEWQTPRCADWVAELDRALAAQAQTVVLAAHSSGCALVAHWALQTKQLAGVHGALLVAPSDPDGAHYPNGPTGFGPVPLQRLPFASIVVTSDSDPYVSLQVARGYAQAWGSRCVVMENAGHINSASGHGAWEQGYALLESLRALT